jgi:flagellar hook-associated protein FlgK
MQPIAATALSGMSSATTNLGAAAHNVANLETPGFRRQIASNETQASGGVQTQVNQAPQAGNALENDMVGLLTAKNSFLANLAVFRAHDRMAGSTLDLFA